MSAEPEVAARHRFDAIRESDLRRRRSAKWRTYADDVLPLWVAEMDFPLAEPVRDALADMVERGDTGYVHPAGLAEAYSDFAVARYGVSVDAATSRLLPDVMGGVHHVLQVSSAPGAGVVFDVPAYPPFFSTIAAAGRRPVPIPLVQDEPGGRFVHDLPSLEAAFAEGAAAYLLCSPHNPTGRVWSAAELESLAELAGRHNVRVLADEVHAPLTYDGVAHVPFASLPFEAARRAVTFVSGSKAWNLPGLKCALAVAGGGSAAATLEQLPAEVGLGAGILGAAGNLAAFRGGVPWLQDTLTYLAGNRALLGKVVADRLPRLRWWPPEGTYLAWLDLRAFDLGPDPAERLLERARVALYAGPQFGTPGHGFARLNFATPAWVLREALDRMVAVLEDPGSGQGPGREASPR